MMTCMSEPQDTRSVSLAECERHTWSTPAHGVTRSMAAEPYWWLRPVPSHHQLVVVLRCAG
eukprot:7862237-Lingulodinium_polyedra.AAC.1